MASDLLRQCNDARAAGLDFPAVWQSLLRTHPLTGGIPIQMSDGTAVWLEVPLTTGQRIVHDPATGYRLRSLLESSLASS